MIGRIEGEVRRELQRLGRAGMADLVAVWPSTVGEMIARNAWPARLARDGTLHVATGSAVWAFELAHLEVAIVDRLREALGGAAPRRLRFAVGRLPEPAAPPALAARTAPPEPTPELCALACGFAAQIENRTLRELATRAARASLAKGAPATSSDRLQ